MELSKLPTELIYLIAQELREQSDRYALILSSRYFYERLISTLYSEVVLFKSDYAAKWYQFMHTVARKPALAETVRDLYIEAWEVNDGTKNFQCDPNLLSQLLNEIPLSDEERDKWEEDAKTGMPDAWLGLILPRLPNLQKIGLDLSSPSLYLQDVLRKAAIRDIQAFSKLEEAYITSRDDDEIPLVQPSYLIPFFHFPSMRKLRGSNIGEYDPERGLTDDISGLPLIGTSGITHIVFRYSANNEGGMFRLIRSCKALKSLRIGYAGFLLLSADPFHFQGLVKSLKHQKTSLERLWMGLDCDYKAEWNQAPVGSLVEFTLLKDLYIRLPDLLDFPGYEPPVNHLKDLLPPSLHTLYFSCCKSAYLQYLPQQLDETIRSRQELQLAKLCIEDTGELECTDPLIVQLRDICSAAGIMFKFVTSQAWSELPVEQEKYRSMWQPEWD